MTAPGQADGLTWRMARLTDLDLLVVLNRQLIEDQRHDSTADDGRLRRRMRRWIDGGAYRVAIVESAGTPVAYAVWRDDEEDGVYVRQFFVVRDRRRSGIGRAAFALLRHAWGDRQVMLDALLHN